MISQLLLRFFSWGEDRISSNSLSSPCLSLFAVIVISSFATGAPCNESFCLGSFWLPLVTDTSWIPMEFMNEMISSHTLLDLSVFTSMATIASAPSTYGFRPISFMYSIIFLLVCWSILSMPILVIPLVVPSWRSLAVHFLTQNHMPFVIYCKCWTWMCSTKVSYLPPVDFL